ncbi:MAG: ATP-binding protein [Burkholderiales bacterium]
MSLRTPQEHDLSDFFENAAIPLHWVGGDGTILRANQAELDFLGYRRDEYVGRHIGEFHADAEVIADILRRLTAGETLRDYPARLRCKDGAIKEVRITSNVQWGENGRFVNTRCITRDVTHERHVAQLKSETSDYLEGLMEGFVAYDRNWVMTYMNAAAERLLNRNRNEVLGKTWREAFPHAVGNPVDLMYQRVMAKRIAERMEYFYPHYGRSLEISASPVASGGVAVYFRDITERQRSRARLELLNEAAAHLLSETEQEPMVRGIYERVREELRIDAYFHYLVSESGNALVLASSAGIPETELARFARLPFTSADDPLAPLARSCGVRAYTCNPLVSGERPIGTLAFASRSRDRFEPDELELMRALTHYVASAYERTRLVRELREADRRKDEFLATLAHELRNPLAPIRNGLQLLRLTEPGSDASVQARAMMERQMNHLVRLVDDLLEVSRISRGKVELRREAVELGAVIASALETSRPAIDTGEHELALDLPIESIRLHADPVRLSQVIANLLNNAAKYTPPGGRIALSARRENGAAVVRVRDNGAGIAPELLGQVFELFVQAERSASNGGLGIGLTLARRLVELHEGTIEARSEGVGRGAEFIVRLPLGSAPAAAEQNARAAPASSAAAERRRVLVVDDNVDAAVSLGLLLDAMGHDVDIAHDGEAALALARERAPELLLLDLSMPGLDGYGVARRVRADPALGDVRIIAMTGRGQDEDRRRSREAGFDAHIVKPVAADTLRTLLEF